MEYLPMWAKDHKEDPLRSLPLGVHVMYAEGEEWKLLHLLNFLRAYYELTDEDFSDANVIVHEKRFPHLWFGGKPASLKWLMQEVAKSGVLAKWVDFGFCNEDQLVFRAYVDHLEEDENADNDLRNFFAEVEASYFGTPSMLDS